MSTKSVHFFVVNNPLKPQEGQRVKLDHVTGKTIAEYVGEMPGDWLYSINGNLIEDQALAYTMTPLPDTNVVMVPIPEGGDNGNTALRLVATIAIASFTGGLGLAYGAWGYAAAAAIQVGGQLLINAILPPASPEIEDQSAPTYGFDGPKNASIEGIPVPLVFGGSYMGGNILAVHNNAGMGDLAFDPSQATTLQTGIPGVEVSNNSGGFRNLFAAVTTHTSAFAQTAENQYLMILLNAGEGPIKDISDVLINDEPAANFATQDFQYVLRPGVDQQHPIPMFSDAVTPRSYNLRLAESTGTWQTVTTVEEVDRVRLDIVYPSGAYRARSEGGRDATQLSLEFRIRPFQGDGVWRRLEDYAPGHSTWINWVESTAALRYFFYSPDLARGRYEIQVRDTAGNSAKHIKDPTLVALNEISRGAVQYNNTALVGISIRATSRIQGIPKVTFYNHGMLLSVFNETLGDFELVWTDNPAWIAYNMLINERWGAGIPASRIDLDAFREWASYCTAAGLKFKGMFEVQSDFWEALGSVYRAGHAQRHRTGNKYSVVVEMPKDPVMVFNETNMIKGSFSQNWTSLEERANEVEVSYADKEAKGRPQIIKVVDVEAQTNGAKIITAKQELRGIEDEEAAIREGEFILRMNKLNHSITFDSYIQSIACEVGDVVNVSHNAPRWGDTAIIESATSDTLTLDRPVYFEGGQTYNVLLHYPSVTQASGAVVSVAGNHVNLGPAPAATEADRLLIPAKSVDTRISSVYTSGLDYIAVVDDATNITAVDDYQAMQTNRVAVETLVQTVSSGEVTQVSFPTPLNDVPVDGASVSFGVSVEVTKPFVVRSITGDSEHRRTLGLLEYSEDVYTATGTHVYIPNPVNYDPPLSAINNVAFDEKTRKGVDGLSETVVEVSWSHDSDRYRDAMVYVSIDSAPAEAMGPFFNRCQIDGVVTGSTIGVRILPRDTKGDTPNEGAMPIYGYTVLGSASIELLAPTALRVGTVKSRSVSLLWGATDADVSPMSAYEIRYINTDDTPDIDETPENAKSFGTIGDLKATVTGLDENTNYRFWVRRLDLSQPGLHQSPWAAVDALTLPGAFEFFEILPTGVDETFLSTPFATRIDTIEVDSSSIHSVEQSLQTAIDGLNSQLLNVKQRVDLTTQNRTIEQLAGLLDVVDVRTFDHYSDLNAGITANSVATQGLDARVTEAEGDIVAQSSQITTLSNSLSNQVANSSIQQNPLFNDWGSTYPDGWTPLGDGSKLVKETVLTVDGTGNAARWQNTLTSTAGFKTTTLVDYFIQDFIVDLAVMLQSGTFQGSGVRIDWYTTIDANPRSTLIAFNDAFDVNRLGQYQFDQLLLSAPPDVNQNNLTSIDFILSANSADFGGAADKDIIVDQCVVRPASATELLVSANSLAIDAVDSRVTSAEGSISSQATQITLLQTDVTDLENGQTANSSAITSLDSRVTSAEGVNTSQSESITNLQNSLTTANNDIAANSTAISGLDSRVTSAEGSITSQASDITTLQSDVQSNTTGIGGNTSAINSLTTRVDSAEGTIVSQANQITNLESTVNNPTTGVNATASGLSTLTTRVTSAEGDITSQATRLDKVEVRATHTGDNLVRKATFEDSLKGDWNPVTVISVSGQPFTKAIRWTVKDAYPYTNANPAVDAFNWFDVAPGETFNLEANLDTATTTHAVAFGLLFRDAAGVTTFLYDTCTLPASTAWTKKKGVVTAPAGAISATPYLRNLGASSFGTPAATSLRIYRDKSEDFGSVQELQQVTLGPDGLEAMYGVKLDVNGYVSGYGLYNDGVGSSFIVRADQFGVASPGATNLTFEVSGGAVYINGVSISPGSVGTSQIGSGAIATGNIAADAIDASKIASAAVTAGKIANNAVGSSQIAASSIDGTKIATAAIAAGHIVDAAVTNAKIGDLAVSGTKIAALAIDSAHIQTAAITNAKIANASIDAAKIGTAAIASAHIQDAAITNAKIGAAAITEAKIGTAAITNAKIANLAVDGAKIASAAIGEAHIVDAAITNAKIGTAAITSAKIANAAIGSAQIANAAIGSAQIATAAITNAKIGTAAITGAKIDLLAVGAGHIQTAAINSAHIGTAEIKTANIENGAITEAKIGTLTAGKITAGTFVNGMTLPNGHIDGGTLTIGSGTGGQGQFAVASDGTVTIGGAAMGGGQLKITATALEVWDDQPTPQLRLRVGKLI